MLEIIGIIALALLAAIGVVLLIAARRPDRFSVSRAKLIGAPPERIFPLINDLKAMNTWNPFALRDPAAQGSYDGPTSGKGAFHTFAGPKSGTGFITIVDGAAPSRVTMNLVMTKPFKADNTVEFNLRPKGQATEVSWTMGGRQPLLAKAMTLFVDCDRMVGKEFDEGLANLKRLAETGGTGSAA